jgi:hypothetical protein
MWVGLWGWEALKDCTKKVDDIYSLPFFLGTEASPQRMQEINGIQDQKKEITCCLLLPFKNKEPVERAEDKS